MGRPLLYSFQMSILGWRLDLNADDIDWLLIDGASRPCRTERYLAVNAALNLWSNAGESETLKARISESAAKDADMHEAYVEWMTPRTKSAEEIKSDEDLAESIREGERKRNEREQSWIAFVEDLRADPEQLRQLRPTTKTSVDGRIYHLW